MKDIKDLILAHYFTLVHLQNLCLTSQYRLSSRFILNQSISFKMRFAPIIITFVATASAMDIGKLLGGMGPLLKKGKCVSPCLVKSVDSLDCNGLGPLTTICLNTDQIVSDVGPCARKCGIPQKDSEFLNKY